jgi:hypothetical protein
MSAPSPKKSLIEAEPIAEVASEPNADETAERKVEQTAKFSLEVTTEPIAETRALMAKSLIVRISNDHQNQYSVNGVNDEENLKYLKANEWFLNEFRQMLGGGFVIGQPYILRDFQYRVSSFVPQGKQQLRDEIFVSVSDKTSITAEYCVIHKFDQLAPAIAQKRIVLNKQETLLRDMEIVLTTNQEDVTNFSELLNIDVLRRLAFKHDKTFPIHTFAESCENGTLTDDQMRLLAEVIVAVNENDEMTNVYHTKVAILRMKDAWPSLEDEDPRVPTGNRTHLRKDKFWELTDVTNVQNDIRDMISSNGDEPILYWGSIIGQYVFLAMGV